MFKSLSLKKWYIAIKDKIDSIMLYVIKMKISFIFLDKIQTIILYNCMYKYIMIAQILHACSCTAKKLQGGYVS